MWSALRRGQRDTATGALILSGFAVWGTVAWIAGIVFVFPVLWMVLTSFKQEQDAASNPPTWFFHPTLEQYSTVFSRNITPYLLNSLMAAIFSTVLVVASIGTRATLLHVLPSAEVLNTMSFSAQFVRYRQSGQTT